MRARAAAQNKLHRNAGPEDLAATEAMLARVTAPGAAFAPAFVAEFRTFTAELRDFFNGGAFADMLALLRPSLPDDALQARARGRAAAPSRRALLRPRTLRPSTHCRKRSCGRTPAAVAACHNLADPVTRRAGRSRALGRPRRRLASAAAVAMGHVGCLLVALCCGSLERVASWTRAAPGAGALPGGPARAGKRRRGRAGRRRRPRAGRAARAHVAARVPRVRPGQRCALLAAASAALLGAPRVPAAHSARTTPRLPPWLVGTRKVLGSLRA